MNAKDFLLKTSFGKLLIYMSMVLVGAIAVKFLGSTTKSFEAFLSIFWGVGIFGFAINHMAINYNK